MANVGSLRPVNPAPYVPIVTGKSVSTIKDLHNPWRDALVPASFRQATFHCEANSRANGRRIVTHEFPKKELPYSEDMGRKAKTFTIRGYCITYPTTLDGPGLQLYNTDYRVARDLLIKALEQIGPGTLYLPTLPPENVVVTSYRLTEEEKFGGYCVFEMEFAEFGLPPQILTLNANVMYVLNNAADVVRQQASDALMGMGLQDVANQASASNQSPVNIPL